MHWSKLSRNECEWFVSDCEHTRGMDRCDVTITVNICVIECCSCCWSRVVLQQGLHIRIWAVTWWQRSEKTDSIVDAQVLQWENVQNAQTDIRTTLVHRFRCPYATEKSHVCFVGMLCALSYALSSEYFENFPKFPQDIKSIS